MVPRIGCADQPLVSEPGPGDVAGPADWSGRDDLRSGGIETSFGRCQTGCRAGCREAGRGWSGPPPATRYDRYTKP